MVVHMGRPRLTRQRRMEILEAAVDVIRERGLCETRIADVARRAGASAALVLYYFDSKDRLLTEALTHAEDRFYRGRVVRLAGLGRVGRGQDGPLRGGQGGDRPAGEPEHRAPPGGQPADR